LGAGSDGSLDAAGCVFHVFLVCYLQHHHPNWFSSYSSFAHFSFIPRSFLQPLVGIYTRLRSFIVVHELKSATLVIEPAAQRSVPVIHAITHDDHALLEV
jgi:hypothetical protein